MKKVFSALCFVMLAASLAAFDFKALSFSLDTEPSATGSRTSGSLEYLQDNGISYGLEVTDKTSSKIENSVEGYEDAIYIIKNHTMEVNLMPYIKHYGSLEKDGFTFTLSGGLASQYTEQSEHYGMTDVNSYMLPAADTGKYFTVDDRRIAHTAGLKFGTSGKIRLNRYLVLSADAAVNPFYIIYLDQNMRYYCQNASSPFDYSFTGTNTRFSTPYVEMNADLQVISLFRLMTSFSYQRLNMQQIDWNLDDTDINGIPQSLKPYDDQQTLMNLRFGVELLAGDAQNAKVKGGIYYETNWFTSSHAGASVTDGKLVFSVGTEK